jgi:hypothetical protein
MAVPRKLGAGAVLLFSQLSSLNSHLLSRVHAVDRISPMNAVVQPVGVGPALVAVPASFGKRHADKRQPYIRIHRYG